MLRKITYYADPGLGQRRNSMFRGIFPKQVAIDYAAYRPSLHSAACRWASTWGHYWRP